MTAVLVWLKATDLVAYGEAGTVQWCQKNVEMHLCRKLQLRLIKADLDECLNVLYDVFFARKVIKEGWLGRQFDCVYQTEGTDWRGADCRGKLYLPVIGYWERVVFSDKSKVEIGANKRVYIWRKAREEWKPECMNTPPRKKFGVMVWGCISYNGVG